MFVRKKKNRSGSISVVVVDKNGCKFKELHTVGIGREEHEIEQLCIQGRIWIKKHLSIQVIDFEEPDLKEVERKNSEKVLDNIEGILLNGAKLILDKMFDSVELMLTSQTLFTLQNRSKFGWSIFSVKLQTHSKKQYQYIYEYDITIYDEYI